MDIKDITSVSSDLKQAFNRAVEAIDKNNLEYATEILKALVLKEPGFVQAREKLRIVEKMQAKTGFFWKALSSIKIKKIVKFAQLDMLRGKYSDAMTKAEDALAIDVRDLSALKILAEAGKGLSSLFIAIEAYELAYGFYPDNPDVIKLLADTYRQAGKAKEELKLRQKLAIMFPNNLAYKQESRSAGALATMEKGKLDNLESSYREKLKDAEESVLLEQQEKIIHNIDDVRELVNKLEEQLKESPDSVPTIRDLAWAYYKAECYEKALTYFQKLQSLQEHFDLSADKALENSELAILNVRINVLAKNTENCEDKEKQMEMIREAEILKNNEYNIRKGYAEKRIKLYPNDLQLRYELAIIYWTGKELDYAIEQFQLAQKHPKWSFSSQVYLGLCFYQKGHYELAIDQLSKAIKIEGTNEKELLEAIYFLGLSFEKMNDITNAKECFKKVYSVNAKYRDISEKIKLYFS